MPISIDRFDDEPDDVLQFLARNDDQAFTQTEIHEATEIKRGSVGAVLSHLEDRGLVRHRGRYWAVAGDDRLASYAAQSGASSTSTTDDYDTVSLDHSEYNRSASSSIPSISLGLG